MERVLPLGIVIFVANAILPLPLLLVLARMLVYAILQERASLLYLFHRKKDLFSEKNLKIKFQICSTPLSLAKQLQKRAIVLSNPPILSWQACNSLEISSRIS
jgi:hypothetical protein